MCNIAHTIYYYAYAFYILHYAFKFYAHTAVYHSEFERPSLIEVEWAREGPRADKAECLTFIPMMQSAFMTDGSHGHVVTSTCRGILKGRQACRIRTESIQIRCVHREMVAVSYCVQQCRSN